MDYETIMMKARATNNSMDQADHAFHFAAPEDDGPFGLLRTAMAAIECGIRIDDWDTVAEGQAMLEKLVKDVLKMEIQLRGTIVTIGCAAHEINLLEYALEHCSEPLTYDPRERIEPHSYAYRIKDGDK